MMNLQEYQSKAILRDAGIPVPASMLATNAVQVKRIAAEIGYPVVLKAQTHEAGRGKAGGVRIVHSDHDIENISNEVFKIVLNGRAIQSILVEKAFTFLNEYYLAILTNFDAGTPILRISEGGGATSHEPESFNDASTYECPIDINFGLQEYEIRNLLTQMDGEPSLWKQFQRIALKLYEIYRQLDASMVEINSLVVTHQNQLYALDTKISLDNQALFRHEDFADTCPPSSQIFAEKQARKFNLNYYEFPGDFGCLVNGVGLAYQTLNKLSQHKHVPAAVIDIQEGPNSTSIASILELLFSDSKIHAIMLNIFGGMTRCDEVAEGLLLSLSKNTDKKPVFIRLKGTNAEKAKMMLESNDLSSFYDSTESLVDATVTYLRGLV